MSTPAVVADRLALKWAVPATTREIPVGGANSAFVQLSVKSATGPTAQVFVRLQESNDLANWTDAPNGEGSRFGIGELAFVAPDVAAGERIGAGFVRLMFAVVGPLGTEAAVCSCILALSEA